MAIKNIAFQYMHRENQFYHRHYHQFILVFMGVTLVMLGVVLTILYQIYNRPFPEFSAVQQNGKKMVLHPFDEPNLLPNTILRWASKAATAAYTFDFVNHSQQIAAARQYFTAEGWQQYQRSVANTINTITANQLFVNGVVSGTPVMASQGDVPGSGYRWRVQIPFLVTYQSQNNSSQERFLIHITIAPIPTNINEQGIGIEQFFMEPL